MLKLPMIISLLILKNKVVILLIGMLGLLLIGKTDCSTNIVFQGKTITELLNNAIPVMPQGK